MEFNGTFELSNATIDEVWLALSDPVMVRDALPGCQFLLEVDTEDPDFDELRQRAEDEEDLEVTTDPDVIMDRAFEEGNMYAAVMSISVGAVNPTFETVVTIDERDKPTMNASGEGSSGNSSFEMSSGMELRETDEGGVAVDWWAEADVFGRIAQMGQRVVNPVANRVVKRFFSDIQDKIEELNAEADDGAPESEGEASAAGGSADAGQADSAGGSKGGIIARIKRLLGLGG